MVKSVNIPFRSKSKILGHLHINKNSQILIIICHGYGDSKDEPVIKRISELLAEKFNVFRFSFTDRNDPHLATEKQNINLIVKYFSKSFNEINLLGASLGGLALVLSAADASGVDKLIFINPFVYYFKKVAWNYRKMLLSMLLLYPFVKKIRENLNFYFTSLKPSLITFPTLLIVADKDKAVDSSHGKILYKSLGSKNKKLIIDQTIDHGLNKETYIKSVVNYINNWLN